MLVLVRRTCKRQEEKELRVTGVEPVSPAQSSHLLGSRNANHCTIRATLRAGAFHKIYKFTVHKSRLLHTFESLVLASNVYGPSRYSCAHASPHTLINSTPWFEVEIRCLVGLGRPAAMPVRAPVALSTTEHDAIGQNQSVYFCDR